RNNRERSVASSDSAIMQLRMSPGGRICNSSRKRPELPPSSETVTIADNEDSHSWSSFTPTNCFNPASSVDRPVPPPIATNFNPELSFTCKQPRGASRQKKIYL